MSKYRNITLSVEQQQYLKDNLLKMRDKDIANHFGISVMKLRINMNLMGINNVREKAMEEKRNPVNVDSNLFDVESFFNHYRF